jgi:galactokinase
MNIVESFKKIYGENNEQIRVFFSPGRVNLIGEHTDYNGGYVLPCALDFGTYAAVRKRTDKKALFASLNFELKVETDLNKIEYKKEDDWANYPKGVLKTIQDRGFDFSGFEILFYGNIPNGAGLSSSASLELAMSVTINDLYNLNLLK